MTIQFAFEFPHRPAFSADDFLVAPSNAAAVAWLDRWPAWPSSAVVLHGPPSCGKTHLAHVWQARSGAMLRAAASLTPEAVPDLAANAAVVIDDAERAAERSLLHLINLVAERGGHLLLTAPAPPARWTTALPDLRSRLVAMPEVAMLAPDDALIGAVLLKLFADRQLSVGEDVIVFLLHHMERSFAAARRLVAALDRAALVARRRITVPLARQVLASEKGPDGEASADMAP
ncbi:MAG TPA: DnaA/Hda family protein [Stellaceae bacterium]|jgi:chromosomal replication initiation ATPase DnaA|nr:DnaA/Hda family protein [Stellaceae bacterium]